MNSRLVGRVTAAIFLVATSWAAVGPVSAKYATEVPGIELWTPGANEIPSTAKLSAERRQADAAWLRLFEPIEGVSAAFKKGATSPEGAKLIALEYGHPSAKSLAWNERQRRQYRERGLEFWNQYSVDTRRYIWLYSTVRFPPMYYTNPEQAAEEILQRKAAAIDHDARLLWERRYLELRAAFMVAPQVSDIIEQKLRRQELISKIGFPLSTLDVRERQWDIVELAGQVADFASNVAASEEDVRAVAENLFAKVKNDPEMERAVVDAFLQSPHKELIRQATRVSEMAMLREHPPELRLTMRDGNEISLASLRGKVVLLDFWTLNCPACLHHMPNIKKELYDPYRSQGLEIIGVCFIGYAHDGSGELDKPSTIDAVLSRLDIPWPQAYIDRVGDDKMHPLAERYAPTGFPAYYLLDKDGRIVAQGNPLAYKEKIRELLAVLPRRTTTAR